MITLYTFGSRFGLPDPSPFVGKAMVLLKMAGLDYRTETGGIRKAPKGKLPFIDDEGTLVADSFFIRHHLETKHGVDFDRGLSDLDKAVGWAVERMCEEHLYWAVMDSRWLVEENWQKGPRLFFDFVPAPLRPLVAFMVRRQMRRNLWSHGLGRHARHGIEALATRDLDAIAAILGDKPWLLGAEPSGADASVWSFVTSALCPHFTSPIGEHGRSLPNLVAYRDRGMKRWFPELVTSVARPAACAGWPRHRSIAPHHRLG